MGCPPTRQARDQFLEVRKQWAGSTVDEFVLGWLPEFQRRYEGYLRLRAETGCPLLKYEDMLADFGQWASDIGDALGTTLTASDVERLQSMGGFERDLSESASRHIRQREPGDQLRKLEPETVDRITDQLPPGAGRLRLSVTAITASCLRLVSTRHLLTWLGGFLAPAPPNLLDDILRVEVVEITGGTHPVEILGG